MAAMSHEDRLDHQLDAERGVIGSLLIDESLVREMVSVVDAQDFLNPANRLIFQAARQLFRDGKPVDALTIRDRVGSQYSDYMTQLMEITPTSANWREYAALMHSQATTQRIKNLAQYILENAVTLDDCRQPCADMAQLLADGHRIDAWTMREMTEDFFRAQDPDAPAPEYVTYGLDVLDQRNYTELGDVVMIGGYRALYAQYQGSADINMGRGAIVIGLAAVIIGEVVFGKIFHNFALHMVAVVIGAIIYFVVIAIVLQLGLETTDLKLFSSLIVALFLALPYLKSKYFTPADKKGGNGNA